ncbi:PIR Superfamily Protein [Plasmodium ovale curtisi]|uniref:PIR Superfamily Protein n=1 Tax=Plasmodium ovale curtisi TaxID=864141 RepID=A0A1A8WHF3_PLAOA|nr:PIR Superfamily Protein [Plasmodium ovale curtisi]
MPCKKEADKYKFCINSYYYKGLVKHAEAKKDNIKKEGNCDGLIFEKKLYENVSVKDICREFILLYESFSTYPFEKSIENDIFTYYDCDFLNYWLNDKLRIKVGDDSNYIKEFYEKIKEKNSNSFSKTKDLEKYMHVIDPSVLENMKLLYNLYDNAVKIISIINTQNYIDEEEKNKYQKSCSEYTNECDIKYKEAMDRCFNSNDDFYIALKNFKDAYDIITKPSSNESNACNSSKFYYFPEYDGVLEKKANAIKISSTLLYTPFGPFLRTKISMVKDRWFNPDKNGDELLPLSTDIEDIISDNENYNIGYYS